MKPEADGETREPGKPARSMTPAGATPEIPGRAPDRFERASDAQPNSRRTPFVAELSRSRLEPARPHTATLGLVARASERSEYGWVQMSPDTANLLGLRPGDAVWLGRRGTPAPFTVEISDVAERDQVMLNPRELAALGVTDGGRIEGSGSYEEVQSRAEPASSDRKD